MKSITLLLTTIFLLFSSSVILAQEYINRSYKVIYESDKGGNAISGSLEQLIEYVESGNPIRVGWELGREGPNSVKLTHWADAGFITIHKGHVFAQIQSIYGQGTSAPLIEVPFVNLLNSKPHAWVAILGTTGLLNQKFTIDQEEIDIYKNMGLSDDEIQEQFRSREQLKVKTKWAALIKE